MKQLLTTGIILRRTDYGEADRIITLLTPDYGKLTLLAKGVRRIKSKLAGGIELFSISHVTFIQGRGDIGTLVSTRLEKYYSHIVEDISRTMLGYELIKRLNKATEDNPEAAYFNLLKDALEALDDAEIALDLINLCFSAQLLRLAGHSPNLTTDTVGTKLDSTQSYDFDFEAMAFKSREDGHFGANEIKFLRLLFSSNQPKILAKVQGSEALTHKIRPLIATMQQLSGF